MGENKKLIVVPWDFTQVAENALAHAVKISRMLDGAICLLHIIEKDIKIADAKAREIGLQKITEENSAKYDAAITWSTVQGSIFSDIAKFVNDKEASLVVMGTHGMKGMQKLTGSWALKVIVKSKAPFIVVQEPPTDQEKYRNIVFPIDFKSENREKLKMAIFMGKYFNSKIHLVVATKADSLVEKRVNANLKFGMKHLALNDVEFEVHKTPKGGTAQKTIDFAASINADLILIISTKNISFADYVIGVSEQYIIANSSKIPVCCVNPMASFSKVGQILGY